MNGLWGYCRGYLQWRYLRREAGADPRCAVALIPKKRPSIEWEIEWSIKETMETIFFFEIVKKKRRDVLTLGRPPEALLSQEEKEEEQEEQEEDGWTVGEWKKNKRTAAPFSRTMVTWDWKVWTCGLDMNNSFRRPIVFYFALRSHNKEQTHTHTHTHKRKGLLRCFVCVCVCVFLPLWVSFMISYRSIASTHARHSWTLINNNRNKEKWKKRKIENFFSFSSLFFFFFVSSTPKEWDWSSKSSPIGPIGEHWQPIRSIPTRSGSRVRVRGFSGFLGWEMR